MLEERSITFFRFQQVSRRIFCERELAKSLTKVPVERVEKIDNFLLLSIEIYDSIKSSETLSDKNVLMINVLPIDSPAYKFHSSGPDISC